MTKSFFFARVLLMEVCIQIQPNFQSFDINNKVLHSNFDYFSAILSLILRNQYYRVLAHTIQVYMTLSVSVTHLYIRSDEDFFPLFLHISFSSRKQIIVNSYQKQATRLINLMIAIIIDFYLLLICDRMKHPNPYFIYIDL